MVLCLLMCVYLFSNKHIAINMFAEIFIFLYCLTIISYIDLKTHSINTKFIMVMVILKIVSILMYKVSMLEKLSFLGEGIKGAIVGGLIIGITAIVNRKSIGMGDAKVFAIVGLFSGVRGVIQIMILSFLLEGILSLLLLITGRKKIKDDICFAPSILLAVLLSRVGGVV